MRVGGEKMKLIQLPCHSRTSFAVVRLDRAADSSECAWEWMSLARQATVASGAARRGVVGAAAPSDGRVAIFELIIDR